MSSLRPCRMWAGVGGLAYIVFAVGLEIGPGAIRPALAAGATPEATTGISTEKFDQGKQAFKAGRFAEALALFSASMELEPSPNTRFQIAKCYVALGKTASAYANFRRAAKEAEDRVNATGEKRYAATREAALMEANELAPKVPHLGLVIPVPSPPGLVVSLDGSPVPAAALGSELEVDPGPHELMVSGGRIKRQTVNFELGSGERKSLEVPVSVLPTATLRLDLKSRPAGLSIIVDDKPLAPAEYETPLPLDVGTHRITGSAPGYTDFTWSGFLRNGEETSVAIVLHAGGSGPPRWATYVTGGGALVALGIGIGFGVAAQSAADEQQMLDPRLRDLGIRDSIRNQAIVANIFYAASGVLALNAVILAATTKWRREPAPPKAKQASLTFTPYAGAGDFGLVAAGRFR